MANALAETGTEVEIETNGTQAPWPALEEVVSQFNVSPKLSNSGIALDRRIIGPAVAAFVDSESIFTFVVRSDECLSEVAHLVERFGIPPARVWIMPEGRCSEEVRTTSQMLAGRVLADGWNMTTRLHSLLWEDERGR